MPLFLDTTGRSTLGIAVCARCGIKMSREELFDDPNYPGLKVCRDDLDVLDPWRLAPRQEDRIAMEWARPDLPLAAQGSVPIYANQFDGISEILPTVPWAANAPYVLGSSVTPLNVNAVQSTQLPQYQFVAVVAGRSGAVPPVWPTNGGVEITDGTVTWLCLGIYLV